MNKKNTTVLSIVVIIIVAIIGGVSWHLHKQKSELNGDWVYIF